MGRVGWMAAAAVLWAALPAAAQDTQPAADEQVALDLHGTVPPAPMGNARSPVTVWSPRVGAAGTWSFGALFEVADSPAIQGQLVGSDDYQPVDVLGSVAAMNLGGWFGVHERLAVGAVLPVFFATTSDLQGIGGGPALGDTYLRVPVGLVLPGVEGGFGISAVPWLQLPTGAQQRFLGDPGVGFGVLAVAGWSADRVSIDLNGGVSRSAPADRGTQSLGGLEVPVAGAAGVRLAGPLWAHGEVRAMADIGAGVIDVPGGPLQNTTLPVEVLLTLSADLGPAWVTGGAGRGVTAGVGSADLRGFVGVGIASRSEAGIEPEAVVPFTFTVTDPAGSPVALADVRVGGEVVGSTTVAGTVEVAAVRWGRGVEVSSGHHLPAAVSEPVDPDVTDLTVVLPWKPQALSVRTTDIAGEALDVTITATPIHGGDPMTGPPESISLPPGTYRVEISAPGKGVQTREIVVDATGRPPRRFEAVLLDDAGPGAIRLQITGVDGTPVQDARVLIDGLPVGTTADGGLLETSGLAPGTHGVLVQHVAYTERLDDEVQVTEGRVTVPMVLERVPGTVRVRVSGPGGTAVSDATARFILGPSILPPRPLGERGEQDWVLGVGEWTLLITSATYGVQERTVVVPANHTEVIEVEVGLLAAEDGDAELRVEVVDASGAYVPGAVVSLDGVDLGPVEDRGSLVVGQLAPGTRTLGVWGDRMRLYESSIQLVPGTQREVVRLRWSPGTVEVRCTSPEGPVSDAFVRFVGPGAGKPSPLPRSGHEQYTLQAGEFVALVTSEMWGVQERRFTVEPDSDVLHRIDVGFLPVDGGLSTMELRVVGPEGRAVPGARVALGEAQLGTTNQQGELRQSGLNVGSSELEIEAAAYRPETIDLRLLEGTTEQEVELDWADGAVRATVQSAGVPVTDAIVRFVGAEALAPIPVDADGRAVAALEPGSWTLLVTSSAMGVSQRTVEVSEDSRVLIEVPVEMAPPDTTLGELVITVLDPERRPVENARVELDGSKLNVAGQGVVVASGLPPGVARLRISAPNFSDLEIDQLVINRGASDRVFTLEPVLVPVEVTVTDQAGMPVQANVRLVGRVDLPPVMTDATGRVEVALRPGPWVLIGDSPSRQLGPTRAEVELLSGGDKQTVRLVLEPARVEVTQGAVLIKEQVHFEFDSATLRVDSSGVLQQVADAVLGQAGIVRIEVQGHSDSVGDIAYNQALSERRAKVVRDALAERGVPMERLESRGYGTQRPIADNSTEAGRAQNRRVVFEIVERVDP